MLPEEISPEEKLGRYVTSRPNAAGRISHHVFYDKRQDAISVDRISDVSCDEATRIGNEFADKNGRTFYGWAVILAEHAKKDGRDLVYKPIPNNPYHTHITLPENSDESKKEHAHFLAKKACFRKVKPQTR